MQVFPPFAQLIVSDLQNHFHVSMGAMTDIMTDKFFNSLWDQSRLVSFATAASYAEIDAVSVCVLSMACLSSWANLLRHSSSVIFSTFNLVSIPKSPFPHFSINCDTTSGKLNLVALTC